MFLTFTSHFGREYHYTALSYHTISPPALCAIFDKYFQVLQEIPAYHNSPSKFVQQSYSTRTTQCLEALAIYVSCGPHVDIVSTTGSFLQRMYAYFRTELTSERPQSRPSPSSAKHPASDDIRSDRKPKCARTEPDPVTAYRGKHYIGVEECRRAEEQARENFAVGIQVRSPDFSRSNQNPLEFCDIVLISDVL
ncbi:hypothetical protein M501DRAFT_626070 [Patellaria atrata CBS 101060]|uniref:Uncharacterized protein n=1 Tax=Patellaria atrata CBS 101060 TaxID=1346257 RepID=A0A9P4SF50_9PEZI|nr:hypothetical protein M501DRAFT_626070 [Patellaria atrata CBS 101060]